MNLGQQRLRAAGAEDTYCALAAAGASYTVAATECDRSAFLRTCVRSTDVQLSIQCLEHQAFVLLFGVVLKLRSLRIQLLITSPVCVEP